MVPIFLDQPVRKVSLSRLLSFRVTFMNRLYNVKSSIDSS